MHVQCFGAHGACCGEIGTGQVVKMVQNKGYQVSGGRLVGQELVDQTFIEHIFFDLWRRMEQL